LLICLSLSLRLLHHHSIVFCNTHTHHLSAFCLPSKLYFYLMYSHTCVICREREMMACILWCVFSINYVCFSVYMCVFFLLYFRNDNWILHMMMWKAIFAFCFVRECVLYISANSLSLSLISNFHLFLFSSSSCCKYFIFKIFIFEFFK
jgi:hypothetical protein